MKTKDEILKNCGVAIEHDGNDYMRYGCTLNKIREAMELYATQTIGSEREEQLRDLLDELVCCVRHKQSGGLSVNINDRNIIATKIINLMKPSNPHDCHGKGYEVKDNTIYCRECMTPLFDILTDIKIKK